MKINIGCGKMPEEGFTNCDHVKYDGVDKVFDLRKKWPFKDEEIDEVRARQILEHFAPGDDLLKLLDEVWRVLKPGAILEAWVPKYPQSDYVFLPDHLSFWTETFVWALATDYQTRGNQKWEIELVEQFDHPEPNNVDVHFKLRKVVK